MAKQITNQTEMIWRVWNYRLWYLKKTDSNLVDFLTPEIEPAEINSNKPVIMAYLLPIKYIGCAAKNDHAMNSEMKPRLSTKNPRN